MRILVLILAMVGTFLWHGGYLSGPVDDSVLVGSGPDECAGAEKCLAVYLAPWCPQCRESGPLVEELRARDALSAGFGFKVILGRDDPEALAKYAGLLGGAVYYDYDGEFWRQIGADGVPAWITWDAEGRIRERLYGRPIGAPPHVLVDHMADELDLRDVL